LKDSRFKNPEASDWDELHQWRRFPTAMPAFFFSDNLKKFRSLVTLNRLIGDHREDKP
jgi:hypothetical protein